MNKIKKILAIMLAVVFGANMVFCQTVYASEETYLHYDLYSENGSETVNIDGINYTYHYFYDNGNRAVTIENDKNNTVDKIVYDAAAAMLHLNGKSIPVLDSAVTIQGYASGDWESLSSDSHYISWAEAVTVAVLAGMIAAFLGSIGGAAVIAAMGTTALGVLAGSAGGGTVYVDLQWFQIPFVAPQYRYVWSFTASTGDSYGPYISHVV